MLGGRQQAGASTSGGDGLAGEVAAEARWLFGRAAAAGAAGAEGRSGAPGPVPRLPWNVGPWALAAQGHQGRYPGLSGTYGPGRAS